MQFMPRMGFLSVSPPYSRNRRILDLAKAGYVEEEFLVSGGANVYDCATDGRMTERASATCPRTCCGDVYPAVPN